MIFFDDDLSNIRSVQQLGVHCHYVPDGLSYSEFLKAIDEFQSK